MNFNFIFSPIWLKKINRISIMNVSNSLNAILKTLFSQLSLFLRCFSIIAQISQTLPLIPQDSSSNASERPWKQGREGAIERSFLLSFIIHTWVPKSLFFLSVSTGKLPFYSWVFPFSSEKKTSISFFQRREVKVKSTSLFLTWYKWRTLETLWCQTLAHGGAQRLDAPTVWCFCCPHSSNPGPFLLEPPTNDHPSLPVNTGSALLKGSQLISIGRQPLSANNGAPWPPDIIYSSCYVNLLFCHQIVPFSYKNDSKLTREYFV